MLFYRAALPLSSRTLTYVSGIIRRHRKSIGSRWRRLNPGKQALLVLAYLRKGEAFAELAAGFAVGTTTAWRLPAASTSKISRTFLLVPKRFLRPAHLVEQVGQAGVALGQQVPVASASVAILPQHAGSHCEGKWRAAEIAHQAIHLVERVADHLARLDRRPETAPQIPLPLASREAFNHDDLATSTFHVATAATGQPQCSPLSAARP